MLLLVACGSLGLQTIQLGAPTEGRVTISPAGTVNFGKVPEDGRPEMEEVTITVSGDAVRIEEIWVESRGGVFELLSQPPVPKLLEEGASMGVKVRFQPTSVADYTGTLLVSTQGGVVVELDLKGEGCRDSNRDDECDR